MIATAARSLRPTRWRVPAGLLGMIALVAAIEAIVTGHRADLCPPWSEDWRFAAWAAEHRAPGADVLCFGDSLVKYGVLPKVIEARTGLKAYNLAVCGGSPATSYSLLKQALAAGSRPRAIVVDFLGRMTVAEPLEPQNHAELASILDCAELAWRDGNARFLGATLVSKALPSYHWRFEVRWLIVAALAGQSGSMRQHGLDFRRFWEAERGAQPMPPGAAWPPNTADLIDRASSGAWRIEPRDEAFLDRFLALAADRGVPVYWLLPPLAPEVHARRARRGVAATQDRLIHDRQARHPDLVILDAQRSGYADSVHNDPYHLDRVGASILSADIAAVVASRNGPARAGTRVALPSASGRAEVVPATLAGRPGRAGR